MANSFTEVTLSSGQTVGFTTPSYLDSSHLTVRVNGVVVPKNTGTGKTFGSFTSTNNLFYTIVEGQTTISFSEQIPSGAVVKISRSTSPDTKLVSYVDNTLITAKLLNEDSNQSFFLSQEALEGTTIGDITGNVTGNVSGSAATVTNAAQPSITSVGTLTGLTTGATTVNGKLTVNNDEMEVISTNADATEKPNLSLYRNSSSPADGDELGSIDFYGKNSADQKHLYAQIYSEATLVADGGEQGHLNFSLCKAASSGAIEDPVMRLRHYGLELLASNDLMFSQNCEIRFEGSTNDSYETSFYAADPTADRTILLPNSSGTLVNNVSGVISESATLMELSSTDAGAEEKPVLSLYRNSISAADNDEMGSIRFFGNNDRDLSSGGGQKVFYAGIYCEAPKTDEGGSHKGSLRFNLADGSGGSVGITDSTAEVAGDKDPVVIMTTTNLELKECDLFVHDGQNIVIDGSSNKTTLTHVEPTSNRTVSLPDADGTLAHIASNGGLQHPTLSSAPSSPANGQTYYNTTDHKLKLYANGAWVDLN